jgi:hypothetical protein
MEVSILQQVPILRFMIITCPINLLQFLISLPNERKISQFEMFYSFIPINLVESLINQFAILSAPCEQRCDHNIANIVLEVGLLSEIVNIWFNSHESFQVFRFNDAKKWLENVENLQIFGE